MAVRAGDFEPFENLSRNADRDIKKHGMETSSLESGIEIYYYCFLGEMKHQDSAGNSGILKAGWVQWMTAGSGVVHSEMPSDEFLKRGGKSEGFQLWVNLPKKDKMIKPRYQDTDAKKIPVVTSPGMG